MNRFVSRLSVISGLCVLCLVIVSSLAAQRHDSQSDSSMELAMVQAVAQTVASDAGRIFGLDSPQYCIANRALAACIHPDTPVERIDEILRSLPTWDDGGRYELGQRWTTTAIDGSTGGNGMPIHLTYSFLDDGVWIPGSSEPGSASRLYATMNLHFGSEAVWKALFAAIFNDWGKHVGITYQEVDDDGAAFPGSAGAVGVRGDVRIGSHYVDGSLGILAYNFFPNVGDMVLDSSENWSAASNNYRYMRNIVRHEHGHGVGMQHVLPENCSKLMEAFLCTNFDGPQDDDIRGAMRYYGDTHERNNTVAEATDLGEISGAFSFPYPASLTTSVDYDYYRFTTTGAALLDVVLDPVGGRYLLNDVYVQTDEIMDLAFRVLGGPNGSEIIAEVNQAGLGDNEVLVDLSLPSAGDYWLFIYRAAGTPDVQRYNLTLGVEASDLTSSGDLPLAAAGPTLFPNPFNPRTTVRFYTERSGAAELDVFDVAGKRVRSVRGNAVSSGWNELNWNGCDDAGAPMPSGTYVMRVQVGDEVHHLRGMLVK